MSTQTTELQLPDPGEGRWWQIDPSDSDIAVQLMAEESNYMRDPYVVASRFVHSPVNGEAVRLAAQKILEQDRVIKEITGTYTYTNGEQVKN